MPTPLPIIESDEAARLNAWVQLARVTHRIQRRVVACLQEAGLTLPQFDVLATLSFSEGVTQQELAGRLLVTKGNVCVLIDRLEGQGWVKRKPDAQDARMNRVYLSPQGRRVVDRVLPIHNKLINQLLGPLSAKHLTAIRSGLARVEEAVLQSLIEGESPCP